MPNTRRHTNDKLNQQHAVQLRLFTLPIAQRHRASSTLQYQCPCTVRVCRPPDFVTSFQMLSGRVWSSWLRTWLPKRHKGVLRRNAECAVMGQAPTGSHRQTVAERYDGRGCFATERMRERENVPI